MQQQLSLFSLPPAQKSSQTSVAGAEHIAANGRVQGVRKLILAALELAGADGFTIEEITRVINSEYKRPTKETSVAGRLAGKNELADFVCKSGRTRANSSGAYADVYILRKWKELS